MQISVSISAWYNISFDVINKIIIIIILIIIICITVNVYFHIQQFYKQHILIYGFILTMYNIFYIDTLFFCQTSLKHGKCVENELNLLIPGIGNASQSVFLHRPQGPGF